MPADRKTAIICTNDAWTLYHFRGSLMRALVDRGFDVVAAGPYDRHAELFASMGVRFAHVPMSHAGLNLSEELRTLWHLYRLYRHERPSLVHHYSHKPILWGSLAARLAGIRGIINTVNGLGSTLGDADGLLRLAQPGIVALMRRALKPPVRITFQNREIEAFYIANRLIRPEQATVILGSGIDTDRFSPDGPPPTVDTDETTPRPLRFLMFSRMLWAKGVKEYCRAAEQVGRRCGNGNRPEFLLVGGAAPGNRTAVDPVWLSNPQTIPGEWLMREAARGYVDWRPHQEDMLPLIRSADVIVLPSYYPEGVPRSLLEAMGCAKAIITTDMPGCRDVVDHGVNGLLIRPRNADDLAKAMLWMFDRPDRATAMGRESRRMVTERFSDARVIDQTMAAYAAAGVAV
jgi:glycosyltransferase involved in cell wall biosynthesis